MLSHLLIKNYALIKHLEMTPSSQLNIITGETGAGKSIMLGAVGLLLGNRVDGRTLFNEEDKCTVEGTFSISQYNLKPLFEEENLDYEDVCIIRREISSQGKSRAFINDTPVTLDSLKKIGGFLMDIHSQHETLHISAVSYQLNIIDTFTDSQGILKHYQKSYNKYKAAQRKYDQLSEEAAILQKDSDYNTFLYKELQGAKIKAGEQEIMEDELKLLENSELIKSKLNEAFDLFSSAEFGIVNQLYIVNSIFSILSKVSDKFTLVKERIESALIELKDITSEIESEEGAILFDPEKVEEYRQRLSLFYQLQKKHNVITNDELLKIMAKLEERVGRENNMAEMIDQAYLEMEEAKKETEEKAESLSAQRFSGFGDFEREIMNLLKDLGMPDAIIKIKRLETALSFSGKDEISILFSANKGIEPQLIKNVASGGEFSRLMLCIKYILAKKTSMPTIIFDEIDTGVSGEIALKLIAMMKSMSTRHQVITITHLPQIAAKGDSHYFVYKDNSEPKTISRIRKLADEERISEIAKMIGGDSPSQAAFEAAKELLN